MTTNDRTLTGPLTAISAAAYGEDVDALDAWEDLAIMVEYDGDNTVILDAYPADLDEDDYPMGRPGIGIRLEPAEAKALGRALLTAVDERAVEDIDHAVDFYLQEVGYLATLPDYSEGEKGEMRARAARLSATT